MSRTWENNTGMAACELYAKEVGPENVVDLYESVESLGFPASNPCSKVFQDYVGPITALNYITYILICVTLVLHFGLLLLTLVRVYEKRRNLKSLGPSVAFLLGQSTLMLIGYSPMLYAITIGWKSVDEPECNTLYFWVTCTYILVGFCNYNMLYYRARSVLHNRLFRRHRRIQLILKLARLGTLMVPFFIIIVYFFFRGEIAPPGVCVVHTEVVVTMLFLFTDTSLSTVFLVLFLYPVFSTIGLSLSQATGTLQETDSSPRLVGGAPASELLTGENSEPYSSYNPKFNSGDKSPHDEHAESSSIANKNLRNMSRAKERVRHTAWRNLKLSSMTICMTFLGLLWGTITPALLGGKVSLENLEYQIHIQIFLLIIAVDRLVVTYVFFNINTSWRPTILEEMRRGKLRYVFPIIWIIRKDGMGDKSTSRGTTNGTPRGCDPDEEGGQRPCTPVPDSDYFSSSYGGMFDAVEEEDDWDHEDLESLNDGENSARSSNTKSRGTGNRKSRGTSGRKSKGDQRPKYSKVTSQSTLKSKDTALSSLSERTIVDIALEQAEHEADLLSNNKSMSETESGNNDTVTSDVMPLEVQMLLARSPSL